jgi:hypothetical protein
VGAVPGGRRALVADPCATAGSAFEPSTRLEIAVSGQDRGAAECQSFGQRSLGWQARTWKNEALLDATL